MIHATRLGFAAAFCIVLLRLAVGYHFFKEGETKIRAGNWTAAPFFANAKGELAPFFNGMLADQDAEFRLCYAPQSESGVDPAETFGYWQEFGQQVAAECRLLERKIAKRRESLREEIERQRADGDEPTELIAQYEADEKRILALREHVSNIGSKLRMHMTDFEDFLAYNQEAISEYFLALERESGFARDGKNREQVVDEVDSIGYQRSTVVGDNYKARQDLVAQVEDAWDAVELDLNKVPVDEYRESIFITLNRPYVKTPILQMIDAAVPWHHMIIGCLIFFGLLCRPASILAALFLMGIAACQLPWATGAAPTYYQIIEMLSALTLAAVGAGRYAGFDYFIEYFFKRRSQPLEGDLNGTYT